MTPSNSRVAGKINSLQYLRAFAALWVLLTHVLQRQGVKPGGVFWAGQWGVDLFFLLSGFIVYLTTRDHSSWKAFAVKRIFRIYPAYWICLLAHRLLSPSGSTGKHGISGVVQDILMMPFDGPVGFSSLTVAQAWSTCYEMYFYALLGILLALGISKRWLLPVIAILFAMTFPIAESHSGNGPIHFFLSLTGRSYVLFFCEGIAISFVHGRLRGCRIPRNVLGMLIGVACLAYGLLVGRGYGFLRSFVASPILFLVVLKANELLPDKGAFHAVWIKLGDISFSLYLIHLLVLGFLKDTCGIHAFFPLLFLTAATTIAFSWACYHVIEKRFVSWGRLLAAKCERMREPSH